MVNRKKLQQCLFITMFFNSCLIIFITSISISTDYWVFVRPFRQTFANTILIESTGGSKVVDSKKDASQSATTGSSTSSSSSNGTSNETTTTNLIDLIGDLDIDDIDEEHDEEDLLPIDLYASKDCKRYNGKIRFGLFKGIWLLNYAYGCKNRINRVSIIDMLSKHKIFDQTLWITTILCCSLALFCTTISGMFSLVNIFISPARAMNGPIGMYLWNTLAGAFHALTLIIFTLEFYLYINKNVLTKDEIESGWISTNRARLGWSFYILFLSLILILVNIGLTYSTLRLKRSFIDLKNQYDKNMNLINGDGNILISCAKPNIANVTHTTTTTTTADYHHIVEPNLNINELNSSLSQLQNSYTFNLRPDETRSSKKLKKIIDFIY